ncbi:transposase [Kineococcus sp. NBC_00420]|uniref:NF041680 family putative transposase n=1 Tax=Kineococcus sp. NBC_00420 TaxID=2903564 RepID=UPI002E1F2721
MSQDADAVEAREVLSRFRRDFFGCLQARADALFELTEALLCTDGAVRSLVELSLVAEHRRGHGAMYDALSCGNLDVETLRDHLAALPLPRTERGRLVLAVDVTCWLRPDATTSAARLFCHVYGRTKRTAQLIPGWQYSMIAALEEGRSSWTAVLDVVRLGPDDDAMAITAQQLRAVVTRLIRDGQWRPGDPDVLIVADAGYDIARLAFTLADLPVQLLGRLRSDRVFRLPLPTRSRRTVGRPPRHGATFALRRPETWPVPTHQTTTSTSRYGIAAASSWDRVHPRLTHRSSWLAHDGQLPVIEGTVIRLQVDHLPGDREAAPVWLWSSAIGLNAAEVIACWQMFLRRFDLEHTFRMFKQTLGWTRPKIRAPEAADRWTWLVLVAHTQLRLARPLSEELRRPWEPRSRPGRLTSARVRRGFRNIRTTVARPARAPKPTRPGPGRPPGTQNQRLAPRYDVGKTTRRPLTLPIQL